MSVWTCARTSAKEKTQNEKQYIRKKSIKRKTFFLIAIKTHTQNGALRITNIIMVKMKNNLLCWDNNNDFETYCAPSSQLKKWQRVYVTAFFFAAVVYVCACTCDVRATKRNARKWALKEQRKEQALITWQRNTRACYKQNWNEMKCYEALQGGLHGVEREMGMKRKTVYKSSDLRNGTSRQPH